MPWHYKHPDTFPAAYGAAINSAASDLNEPYMLGGFNTKSEAEGLAERIRHFKFCIRNTPIHELQPILDNYDIRTFIHNDGFSFILWLVARPTKISDFVENNPDLAKEILSQV